MEWAARFWVASTVTAPSTAVIYLLGMGFPESPIVVVFVFLSASVIGAVVSLIPGLSVFVAATTAMSITREPVWERHDEGDWLLLAGSIGPSVFLFLAASTLLTRRTDVILGSNVYWLIAIATGLSVVAIILLDNVEPPHA